MIVSLSILSAPLLDLGTCIKRMLDCKIDRLHLDVMDGHYVPRIAFGLDWVKAVRQSFPDLPIDAHLMVHKVEDARSQSFLEQGTDRLWLHYATASRNLQNTHTAWVLELHEDVLALPPKTSHVLLMAVIPGEGGQTLNPHVYNHIRAIQEHNPHIWMAVDGGVNASNITSLRTAGVHEVIMGQGLLLADNPKEIIKTAHAISQ